jgi:hypothetical protein
MALFEFISIAKHSVNLSIVYANSKHPRAVKAYIFRHPLRHPKSFLYSIDPLPHLEPSQAESITLHSLQLTQSTP